MNVRKIRKLTWQKFGLLMRAVGAVLIVKVMLKVLPYRKVLAWVEKKLRTPAPGYAVAAYQDNAVWAVRAVARRTLGDKPCLTQALALKWLLGSVGQKTELEIGVKKNKRQELEAHAWLKAEDKIIIGGRTSPAYYETLNPMNASNSLQS